MVTGTLKRGLSRITVGAVIGLTAAASFSACGGGTHGGSNDVQAPTTDGSQSARGSIEIIPNESTLAVGDEVGFRVRLRDANGAPLTGIRIFCDSERGIAITEPSSGGTSFESTDSNGEFSGRFGAVSRGSYLVECRGPQGFNLVDRITLIATGDAPQGFSGFPGAGGGNLGGGSVTRPDPGIDGGEGLRVTDIRFFQNGEDTGSSIDSTRNCNCAGVPIDEQTTVDPEPFGPVDARVTIRNTTNTQLRVDSVSVSLGGSTFTSDDDGITIPADGSGTIVVQLANASGRCQVGVDSGPTLSPMLSSGTVVVQVAGTTNGSDVVVTSQKNASVADYDNCD